ncbi:CaiB/BaiF CoA-transferase family protein [Caballeronia sp. dw_19]|uniref:CaiB/BaiF CoA transferase family protein n=1 Tax=Caballeronia sp. dw_19 TaxID=2719791 RepID=UPI001BD5BA70|nr:CaiB/BaiF CoA-transferase family protein [Caballeronia sp. dw_19]
MKALEGLRVLDLGTFVAGPFCATILAEFGAEVIKVEPPGVGDSLRRFGTETDCGDTLMWLTESRNKKCVSLNLKDPKGQEMLRQLAASCDIVVENFRPGVIEKWGLDFDTLHALNPRTILVRISAYGQNGPSRLKPGFARVAHAFSGLSYLAGEPGRIPVTPGSTSLADYGSGMYGAIGALIALQAREKTGRGQCVDLALYESMFRVLDEMVPVYHKLGKVRERMGANAVNVAPHSHYRSRDGRWIAIACTNDKIFKRFASVMNQPELASEDRWGRVGPRVAAVDEVNQVVQEWVGMRNHDEVLALCDQGEVPASLLYSVADIFEDEQYQARENIRVMDSRAGEVAVPNVIPKLSETPGALEWLGEELGGHNDEIFRDVLGLSVAQIEALRVSGVI